MTRRITIALSLSLLVAALLIAERMAVGPETESIEEIADRLKAAARAGSKEDPDARARYLFEKIKDPQTGRIPKNIFRREQEFARRLPKREYVGKTEAATWVRRGPANVGGRTRALAVDVSNASRIVAGGVSGGLYLSTDAGVTWSKRTGAAQLHSVSSLVQDTRSGKTGTWYAGTGELAGNSASGGSASFRGDGVYKSTDGGSSWSLLTTTSTDVPQSFDQFFDYVHEVAVDPSNATQDEVYAATYGCLYRSLDGGSTAFTVVHGCSGSVSVWTDVVVTSTGVVYTAFSSDGEVAARGVHRSTSGASGTFTDITPVTPTFAASYGRIELAVNPTNENLVWALLHSTGSTAGHELWQYDAGTTTWTDYSAFIPTRGGVTGDFSSQGAYDLVIKAHPTNADVVFIGGTNLFRIDVSGTAGTPGSGDTWIGGYTHFNGSYVLYANHHPDQHAIAFLPPPWGPAANNPDVMWTGSDGGVHRTDNSMASGDGAVSWTSLNDEYWTTQFYSICMNSDATDPFVGGGMQDNGTWGSASASSSVDWIEQSGGDGGHCQIANESAGPNTFRYPSAQEGVLYRQKYSPGGSRLSFEQIDPDGATSYIFISPFVLDPDDEPTLYVLEESTIWRTNDAETVTPSTGWTDLAPTFPSPPTATATTAIAVENNTLYIGTDGCEVYKLASARSAAPGSLVSELKTAAFPSLCYVSDIAINPSDEQEVLIAISNYATTSLLHTTNGGTSWTDVEGNLVGASGPSVRTVAILPGASTTYFAGTSTGMYSTTSLSGTPTWAQEGASTIGNVVVDMVRARADGTVLAGTHGNGVFSSVVSLGVELATFDVIHEEGEVVLRWSTASEVDNLGFDIEMRTGEESGWLQHGFVEGRGSTSQLQEYEYRVTSLLPGRYEFRLTQIDFDGSRSESELVETVVEVPGQFLIGDAFPNPFSGSAIFNIAVRKRQNVLVSLFDLQGREVRRVHDGVMSEGVTHKLSIDAAGLAGGMYVVQFLGDGFAESRTVTVVR